MNRKLVVILSAALIALAAAALAWWLSARSGGRQGPEPVDLSPGLETPVAGDEAVLYFPGRRDKLYSERRELSAEFEGETKIRLVITELLQGPTSDELSAVLPPELEVGGVSLDADGVLFLDLTSKSGGLRGMGSTSELLAVYSLVNTVLANEPDARAVVLLWNGRQHPSLAGHVDTARPLTANSGLIAESS